MALHDACARKSKGQNSIRDRKKYGLENMKVRNKSKEINIVKTQRAIQSKLDCELSCESTAMVI
jgi:CxxC motif-containing protein